MRLYAALVAIAALLVLVPGATANDVGCGFDLFVLNGGVSTDVTAGTSHCAFNPDWSPNGQKIVFDQSDDVTGQHLSVLDLATGTAAPLTGGDAGNNGVYSPNGEWIAFDRWGIRDTATYRVPAAGGVPQLLVPNALDPRWSPDGRRIAFTRPSDWSIGTAAVDGGDQTTVAPAGAQANFGCQIFQCGLAWSPNGHAIAYSDNADLWIVHVTTAGVPVGAPELLLAGGPFIQSHPAWSQDGKWIVFTSDRAGDGGFALYRVGVDTGVVERIAGANSFNEFDPAVAHSGAIVYPGSTP